MWLVVLVGARLATAANGVDCAALLKENIVCQEAAKYLVEHHAYAPFVAFTRLMRERRCPRELAKTCSAELIIPVALQCERALRRISSRGVASCGARIAAAVHASGGLGTRDAIRLVAREHAECASIELLGGCESSVALQSIEACRPSLFNDVRSNAPTVLISLQHSAGKVLRSLLSCTGVATEVKNVCSSHLAVMGISDTATRETCLERGGYHIVDAVLSTPEVDADEIVARIEWLHTYAGGRPAKSRIIILTRSPLEVVFSWLEATVHKGSLDILQGSYSWKSLRARASSTSRLNKELASEYEGIVSEIALQEAAQFVADADGLTRFATAEYDSISISIEDLRDPTRRFRIVSEVISHALGGTFRPTAREVLHAFSAADTAYRTHPPPTKTDYDSQEFWHLPSGLLCEVLAIDGFVFAAAQLGYGALLYNDVVDCSLQGTSLLDVKPLFHDALRRSPRTSCGALGFIDGLDEKWRADDADATSCSFAKNFFAPNHEYCCSACYERGCLAVVYVLASPLEEAGMCHIAMDESSLSQLYACYEASRDESHVEGVSSSRRPPGSYTVPVAIVGASVQKTLDTKAVAGLQQLLDSGGLQIVTMWPLGKKQWALGRTNDGAPDKKNLAPPVEIELTKTVYMSNAFTLGSDVAVRLAPYSYCAVDKPEEDFLSSWEDERSMVVGPQYMPSYLTIWLKDGDVQDILVNAEDPRLYRLDNGELYASIARHSWEDLEGGTEQWLIRLEPERHEIQLMFPGIKQHERNWAPIVHGDMLYFVYSFCPYILLSCDAKCRIDGVMSTAYSSDAPRSPIEKTICGLDLRGTSNFEKVILDPQRGPELLGVVHRTIKLSGLKVDRLYMHSFITLDTVFPFHIRRVSQLVRMPSLFQNILDMIQFASGLHVPAIAGDDFLPKAEIHFDYGVSDCVSMEATVMVHQVAALLDDFMDHNTKTEKAHRRLSFSQEITNATSTNKNGDLRRYPQEKKRSQNPHSQPRRRRRAS